MRPLGAAGNRAFAAAKAVAPSVVGVQPTFPWIFLTFLLCGMSVMICLSEGWGPTTKPPQLHTVVPTSPGSKRCRQYVTSHYCEQNGCRWIWSHRRWCLGVCVPYQKKQAYPYSHGMEVDQHPHKHLFQSLPYQHHSVPRCSICADEMTSFCKVATVRFGASKVSKGWVTLATGNASFRVH